MLRSKVKQGTVAAKMADMIVSTFEGADPGSMKGVKVLFIGNAADSARVEAAVAPAGGLGVK